MKAMMQHQSDSILMEKVKKTVVEYQFKKA